MGKGRENGECGIDACSLQQSSNGVQQLLCMVNWIKLYQVKKIFSCAKELLGQIKWLFSHSENTKSWLFRSVGEKLNAVLQNVSFRATCSIWERT